MLFVPAQLAADNLQPISHGIPHTFSHTVLSAVALMHKMEPKTSHGPGGPVGTDNTSRGSSVSSSSHNSIEIKLKPVLDPSLCTSPSRGHLNGDDEPCEPPSSAAWPPPCCARSFRP